MCELFFLLWTFLIVFSPLFFCVHVSIQTWTGIKGRLAEGAEAAANHPSWFCNMYSRGEVPSSGNSRLSAWKRTKGRCYLSPHSLTHEIWDGTTRLSSAHPIFLWGCGSVTASKRSRLCRIQPDGEFAPAGICLAWLYYFLTWSGAMTKNTSWIRYCSTPPLWTHPTHPFFFFFVLTYAETQQKLCRSPACYSVFHHFLIILLPLFFPSPFRGIISEPQARVAS